MKSMNDPSQVNSVVSLRNWKEGLELILLVGAVLFAASCGGTNNSNSTPPATNQGQVVIFAGDAPPCDVVSFSMTITGMTLTPSSGGAPVSVISSNNPAIVDFASLMGTSMMLGSANVPAGSYSQATLMLSNPQMGVYSSGSYGMMNSILGSSTVNVTLNPPLTVTSNAPTGMMLDMNLLQSIAASNGSVTGTINPTFTGGGMSGSEGGTMMGGLAMLSGVVASVSTTSSNSAYTGSFTLDQWMMGQTFTLNVTAQTAFQGIASLSALTTGEFVQDQASVDSSGNLVATRVFAEGQTNGQQSMGAFMGEITSANRDSSGNATQFLMGMDGEFPEMQSMMGVYSQPQVTLGSGVNLQIEDLSANFAQLSFDPTTMGPGQLVTVIGQIAGGNGGMMGGNGSSLTANSVIIDDQALLGTFGKVLANSGDDKTGGFALTPCSSVFGSGSVSIPILTSSQTVFTGMTGLNEIPASSQLVVNGLLFWEPALTNANGVQFTPPGWVFESTQVGLVQ